MEGAVGRIFRTSVSRVEITKRLERELDSGAGPGRLGLETMPNAITVRLNPRDLDRLGSPTAGIERELAAHARAHARGADCGFAGPVVVTVTDDPRLPVGTMEVTAREEESVAGAVPGTLILPDGSRFDLVSDFDGAVVVGRGDDADLVIDDELASRRHARLRSSERGWVIDDLESTNGTRVNGFRTRAQLLGDGDNITIGATTFTFEAS